MKSKYCKPGITLSYIVNKFPPYVRCGQLTWHDGSIPAEELWVKLGGDKGHGVFKFTVQLVNVMNPNSRANTCIVAMFLGNDSVANLWTALQQYQEQVDELEEMKWRYTCTYIIHVSMHK